MIFSPFLFSTMPIYAHMAISDCEYNTCVHFFLQEKQVARQRRRSRSKMRQITR